MPQPRLLSKAWASDGLKNSIPNTRNSGMPQEGATYADGFPSITMTPISTGGKPPSGKDMNGVLYEISAHTVWQNQGGRYRFDQAFCDAIGGYPKGAVLINDTLDTEYISLVDANTHNPNSGNNTGKWAIHAGKGLKASTAQAGIVQLSSATDSDREDMAATPKAVKAAYDKAVAAESAASGAVKTSGNNVARLATDKMNVATTNYYVDQSGGYNKSGFYRSNGRQLDGNALPAMEIHIAHPEVVNGAHARGIGFSYGSSSNPFQLVTSAWDGNGRYIGMKTVLTEENGVMLSNDQTVGGVKTFTSKAVFSGGLSVSGNGKSADIHTGPGDIYLRNSKSNKYLQLKDNGELCYSDKRLLNVDDLSGMVPSGAVMYFSGQTAPSGWLKANGAAVSRTTYAALFAAIGERYGRGDGRTTFNLPDLRGEFVRGWDDGRGVDRNRALGSWQADEFRSHSHGIGVNRMPDSDRGSNSSTVSVDTVGQTDPAGGIETRPRNIALLACIKA